MSGLNDTYAQSKRQILMKSTEPCLNQYYAMIMEEESYRFISDTGKYALGEGNDITAFWGARGAGSSGGAKGAGQF